MLYGFNPFPIPVIKLLIFICIGACCLFDAVELGTEVRLAAPVLPPPIAPPAIESEVSSKIGCNGAYGWQFEFYYLETNPGYLFLLFSTIIDRLAGSRLLWFAGVPILSVGVSPFGYFIVWKEEGAPEKRFVYERPGDLDIKPRTKGLY